jgi:hypothetical protein
MNAGTAGTLRTLFFLTGDFVIGLWASVPLSRTTPILRSKVQPLVYQNVLWEITAGSFGLSMVRHVRPDNDP